VYVRLKLWILLSDPINVFLSVRVSEKNEAHQEAAHNADKKEDDVAEDRKC